MVKNVCTLRALQCVRVLVKNACTLCILGRVHVSTNRECVYTWVNLMTGTPGRMLTHTRSLSFHEVIPNNKLSIHRAEPSPPSIPPSCGGVGQRNRCCRVDTVYTRCLHLSPTPELDTKAHRWAKQRKCPEHHPSPPPRPNPLRRRGLNLPLLKYLRPHFIDVRACKLPNDTDWLNCMHDLTSLCCLLNMVTYLVIVIIKLYDKFCESRYQALF